MKTDGEGRKREGERRKGTGRKEINGRIQGEGKTVRKKRNNRRHTNEF